MPVLFWAQTQQQPFWFVVLWMLIWPLVSVCVLCGVTIVTKKNKQVIHIFTQRKLVKKIVLFLSPFKCILAQCGVWAPVEFLVTIVCCKVCLIQAFFFLFFLATSVIILTILNCNWFNITAWKKWLKSTQIILFFLKDTQMPLCEILLYVVVGKSPFTEMNRFSIDSAACCVLALRPSWEGTLLNSIYSSLTFSLVAAQ